MSTKIVELGIGLFSAIFISIEPVLATIAIFLLIFFGVTFGEYNIYILGIFTIYAVIFLAPLLKISATKNSNSQKQYN